MDEKKTVIHNKSAFQKMTLTIMEKGIKGLSLFFIFFSLCIFTSQLYDAHRTQMLNDTHHMSASITEWFSQAEMLAAQLSNNVVIRTNLIAHKQKALSLEEIEEPIKEILSQALISTKSHTVLGITQLDIKGIKINSVGLKIPEHYLLNTDFSWETIIDGPYLIKDLYFILLSTPIFDTGQKIIGSTIVAFSLNGLEKLFIEKQLSLRKNTEIHLAFFKKPLKKNNAEELKFLFDPNKTVNKILVKSIGKESTDKHMAYLSEIIAPNLKNKSASQFNCCLKTLIFSSQKIEKTKWHVILFEPLSSFYFPILFKALYVFLFMLSVSIAVYFYIKKLILTKQ